MSDFYRQIYISVALNEYDKIDDDIIFIDGVGEINLKDPIVKKFFDHGLNMRNRMKKLLNNLWSDEFNKDDIF